MVSQKLNVKSSPANKMIKNQSIVDLWNRSGELLKHTDLFQVSENINYYNVLIGRIEQLCISSHDDLMTNIIPEYIKNGWIKAG